MNCLERCWLAALSLAAVVLAGCSTAPASYSVPEQHLPFNPLGSARRDYVAAGDLYAPKFFVKDIVPLEGGDWRWTRAEPELRFFLESTQRRRLLFDFNINENTFKDTGPVTISFFVNDRMLGRERYDGPGDHLFEKPVPSDWLRVGEETRVRASIENVWRTPEGPLGILFKRAGILP